MWQLLLFIIILIVFQKLSKTLQQQQEQQQRESGEEKIGDLFKTLGFPLPEEIPPKPEWKKPEEPLIVKRKVKKPEVKITELKPLKPELPPEEAEVLKEEELAFPQDKLEQGIILSEILGPPKAYQIRRGGGIG